MTGNPRRTVGGNLFPDIRPQAIGTDQQRPGNTLAGSEPRRHRRAVLIVADHFGADAQIDQVVILAGFQQYAVQVAAMRHRVRVAEARAEGIAQVDMGDLFRCERIHQPQLVDIDRRAPRRLADPEIVEGMERVGSELEAGADFAQASGLFEQDRANPLSRKPERRGQAADAAARDQDRSCAWRSHQLDLPRCSSASSARSGTRDDSLLRSTSCVNSAISVLRSAGFNGCSIRACARSTDGMISRNSAAPVLVR